MTDTENRTLEPTGDPRLWVCLTLEKEVHVYPNFGPKHQTRNCWCQPEIVQDVMMDVPMFSHRELH
jgi:hypothetical protein